MSQMGILRKVPPSPKPRFDNPPVIRGDCLIIADPHIPFHDAAFLDNVLTVAHAWGIRQGVVAGDLCDETAFSFFGQRPDNKIWETERRTLVSVMEAMKTAVPKWWLLNGNHEMRLIKLLAEQIDHAALLRLIDGPSGFEATDYYMCRLETVRGLWLVCHPRNISVIPGRVPQFLAEKYSMNTAASHGHLVGFYPTKGNQHLAIDIGVCCDQERLDWIALRPNTRPAFGQGALILKDGYPYLLSPLWTDWDAMMRLYGA